MYSRIICDNLKLHEKLIETINQMITVWAYMIDEKWIYMIYYSYLTSVKSNIKNQCTHEQMNSTHSA